MSQHHIITGRDDPGVNLPKPKRDYDSAEFYIEKRFASRWSWRSSYLWSRLYGNYSGLSQSDENGRTSPNVGRLYDYPLMMFQDGGPISSKRSSFISSRSERASD